MLKKVLVLFLIFSVFAYANGSAFTTVPSNPKVSVTGIVTNRISGCDYFVVRTKAGYDVLEWYGDYDPDKGDALVGNYEIYGFHDVYDETADQNTHI